MSGPTCYQQDTAPGSNRVPRGRAVQPCTVRPPGQAGCPSPELQTLQHSAWLPGPPLPQPPGHNPGAPQARTAPLPPKLHPREHISVPLGPVTRALQRLLPPKVMYAERVEPQRAARCWEAGRPRHPEGRSLLLPQMCRFFKIIHCGNSAFPTAGPTSGSVACSNLAPGHRFRCVSLKLNYSSKAAKIFIASLVTFKILLSLCTVNNCSLQAENFRMSILQTKSPMKKVPNQSESNLQKELVLE